MSISLRKHRARLFDYIDAGSQGDVDSAYALNASDADDDAWWCSRALPTGRESTLGMKAEHRVDAVFAFDAHAPISVNSAIDCEGESFVVRAVLTRDFGTDEIQVLAERMVGLTLTAS